MTSTSRRNFLKFLGLTVGAPLNLSLVGCNGQESKAFTLPVLQPHREDAVKLVEGLNYQLLVGREDELGNNLIFGDHCDFTCFLPGADENSGFLWVNNEYLNPLFVTGRKEKDQITREQYYKEAKMVGGSFVEIKKVSGQWKVVKGSSHNHRLDGLTRIPFSGGIEIDGEKTALGTFGNCAGGLTPWGSILTCEENYDMFTGEYSEYTNRKSSLTHPYFSFGWHNHEKRNPAHYGWVVEFNPRNKSAKKLIALGRFRHEGACVTLREGKLNVYMGDDKSGECLYKFVSDTATSLDSGTLYVANFVRGEWLALDWETQPKLKEKFASQLDVLIHAPAAAKILGGTPLERPEDIEVSPHDGSVIVALTGIKGLNPYGRLVRIEEVKDSGNKNFTSSTFLAGGESNGFSSPDNLCFDPAGNLWMTSDISGSKIGKGGFKPFGNNSLFYIPMKGDNAGKIFRFANAPVDAEFTGPSFTPDGKTLFLSVQHPGERSQKGQIPTSKWPTGTEPKSTVLTISGPLLEKLMSV